MKLFVMTSFCDCVNTLQKALHIRKYLTLYPAQVMTIEEVFQSPFIINFSIQIH